MKKFIAGFILVLFCCMIVAPVVEAKTNATKKTSVSSYRKNKYGAYKHVNYKRTQHYKK